MIKEVCGNLLEHDAKYIAHQCNCVSTGYAGIAKAIYNKYPYSDVYSTRKNPDKLGTIKVCGNGKDKRYIINMFSQYYPGTCKYPDGGKDNPKLREESFKKCLDEISKIKDLESIAFPYLIGCGLAGGNWDNYEKMIYNFAHKNFLTDVYLVKLQ